MRRLILASILGNVFGTIAFAFLAALMRYLAENGGSKFAKNLRRSMYRYHMERAVKIGEAGARKSARLN